MLTAIYFNNHSCFETDEVHDISTERHLSAKSATVEPSAPQLLPQIPFDICHVYAQQTG
jgi:hypothetical protein